MPTANDIAARLEEAATKAGGAGPESPETVSESESTVSEAQEQVSHEDRKQVPLHENPRFKEVILQKNQAIEAFEAAQAKLQELEGQQSKLIQMLDSRERDSEIVNQIRAYAADSNTDDRVRSAIETLEAAMTGNLEDVIDKVEENVEAGKISLNQAKQMVNEAKSELEEQLLDQRADMLWTEARNLASTWLENLPEEYAEEDVASIDEMFLNRVDWDAIESDPSQMSAELYEAFVNALDAYGEPRGAILQMQQKTHEGAAEPEAEVSEDDIVGKVREIQWGKVGEDGKPVISDEEFTSQLAQMMKFGRGTS